MFQSINNEPNLIHLINYFKTIFLPQILIKIIHFFKLLPIIQFFFLLMLFNHYLASFIHIISFIHLLLTSLLIIFQLNMEHQVLQPLN